MTRSEEVALEVWARSHAAKGNIQARQVLHLLEEVEQLRYEVKEQQRLADDGCPLVGRER